MQSTSVGLIPHGLGRLAAANNGTVTREGNWNDASVSRFRHRHAERILLSAAMALSQAAQFEHAAAIGSGSGRLLQAVLTNDLPERDRALVAIAEAVLAFQKVLDSKPAASKPAADSKGTAGSARAAPKRAPVKRASSAASGMPKVRTREVRCRMSVCGFLESFESIVFIVICAGSCDASLARISVCVPQLSQKKTKAGGGVKCQSFVSSILLYRYRVVFTMYIPTSNYII